MEHTVGRARTPVGPSSAVGRDASPQRIVGLDSIRFVCAFIVLVDHLGLTPDRIHGQSLQAAERVLAGTYNSLFNGPAAVIVFFIISGFCIHFPYRDRRAPELASYYTRRFIRILPPAIVLMICLRLLGNKSAPQDTILWSVICEMIYYLIYPALLLFRRRFGMLTMLTTSSIICAVLISTHTSDLARVGNAYGALGNATWIVGLPCWIVGCWLAENYQRFAVPSSAQIWLARGGIFALSVGLRMVKFHVVSPWASNCVTLNLFSIPACIWIGLEVKHFSRRAPFRLLEWAGGWSYSLYLAHGLVPYVVVLFGFSYLLEGASTHWLFLFVSLAASYGFFLLIERPCHILALKAGNAVKGRRRLVLR